MRFAGPGSSGRCGALWAIWRYARSIDQPETNNAAFTGCMAEKGIASTTGVRCSLQRAAPISTPRVATGSIPQRPYAPESQVQILLGRNGLLNFNSIYAKSAQAAARKSADRPLSPTEAIKPTSKLCEECGIAIRKPEHNAVEGQKLLWLAPPLRRICAATACRSGSSSSGAAAGRAAACAQAPTAVPSAPAVRGWRQTPP